MTRAATPSRAERRGRKALWKRKRLWATLIVLLLPGLGMVVATRTNALQGAVLSGIEGALGCEASASKVRLTWDGAIVVTDLRIEAPGVTGPAGQVLLAPRVVARVDWGSALSGSPEVTELRLIGPDLRLSQHVETGLFNVSALRGASGGAGVPSLPRFEIVDGKITLGEHSDQWYSPLNGSTLRVDGTGGQSEADPDVFLYSFSELDASGQQAPGLTRVTGNINLEDQSFHAELASSAVDLSEWSSRSLPSAYQELWERVNLRGRIPGASISYTPATGLFYGVELDRVTMRLPLDLREEEGQQLVDLTDVSGTIGFSPSGYEVEVTGSVEDIPSVGITLEAARFTPDTPVRALLSIEGYAMDARPALLPVAPEIVDKILARFGMPEGELDVMVNVSRDEPTAPGTPAPWRYAGEMDIRGGRAAFEEFPYPVDDITARFEFDESTFRMVRFEGVGASGGDVRATARITPPGDGAEVVVDVEVRGVMLDERFREAMPESRRAIFDVLFDRVAYERLREAGLLRSSDDDDNGSPVFDLAGRADLDIRVYRPVGMDSSYTTDIDVRIDEAGIVPVAFAYPVVGRDIELAITPRKATVRSASLHGLTGMTGSIEGDILFPEGGEASPDLTITARTTPIDRVLAMALPDGSMTGGTSPREALLELGMSGEVSATARVRRDSDPAATDDARDRIGFEVLATLENVASSSNEALRLEGVTGALRITRDDFEATDLAGTIGGSPFTGEVGMVFARPLYGIEQSLMGSFEASNIDVAAPFEDLAARFDEGAASALVDLRERVAPRGRVDARLSFSTLPSADIDYALRLEPRSDLSIRFGDERWVAHDAQGVVRVTPTGATFDAFSAAIGVDRGERFTTLLDGTLALGAGPGTLDVRSDGVHLDSRTARTMIAERFPEVTPVLETLGIVDAVFDLEAVLAFEGGATDAAWRVTTRAIDLDRLGVRTETDASGVVEGDGSGVRVRDLRLGCEAWDLTIDGARDVSGSGVFRVGLDAPSVSDSLLSLVPARVGAALRGMEIDAGESFSLRDATLTLAPDAGPVLEGSLAYEGLSARIGTPIDGAFGRGVVRASEEAFEVTLELDRMRVAGVDVSDAKLHAVRHAPGEDLMIPVLSGRVHDGRLMGRGVVRTSSAPVTYEFSAELSSVRFAGVLEDLGIVEAGGATDRGLMDAGLLMHGRLDRSADRRGRATVRVQGGRVLDLPGIIPLLELSNLQAPSNERVDLGYMDLFVAGDVALVDRVRLFSDSLRIVGVGSVDLRTMGVDLAFSTYGSNYVPILSPLIEGIREEIASTRVTGTLGDPEFRTEQLRTTRALLDAIAGSPSPNERTPDTSARPVREPGNSPGRP